MLAALFHSPQFLASERIVRICRLGPQADHLPTTVYPLDMRSRERLAQVAVGGRLPILVQILEIDGSLGLPNRLPSTLVKRHHELTVAAIKVHQQQVAEQDRRRSGA